MFVVRFAAWSAALFSLMVPMRSMAQTERLEPTAEVEGITAYRLENGLQILLFPDSSKPTVTVNLTIFVGSRHEGYGEAGMAHLLEHMLFKGTPSHPNIPKVLQDRGADFNGTTWVDRTNYYETLPASDENLEFALRLEADRMVNSLIRAEDLASEMTVVRNEFESGENNPVRVLLQRVQATAYEWHNYGKSTIGNRSDIERVPITNLRAFYRKHYQPDNALLIVAGSFDRDRALEKIVEYFGPLEAPDRELDRTYTEEPAQDGERTVVLRRVGDVCLVAAAYHIPASSHPDFEAVQVLQNLMTSQPTGRLYSALIKERKASAVFGTAFAFHDPGLVFFATMVPREEQVAVAQETLLATLENVVASPPTDDEVERARDELLAARELEVADSQSIAISLSDWAAQGDWRLFFVHRDRLESVTTEDVVRVAATYLQRNNRTLGLFLPTEKAERVAIPAAPDIRQLVDDYQGREALVEGEAFDPSPAAIGERLIRRTAPSGIQVALLPKRTRGEMVQLNLTLRYGNESSLAGLNQAASVMTDLMARGTERLDHAALQEALNRNRTELSTSGQRGLANFTLQVPRSKLLGAIDLLRQILREPRFDANDFEEYREQLVSGLESRISDPQSVAGRAFTRAMAPADPADIRYVPTLEEELALYRALSLDQVRELYRTQLSGMRGELVVVGDFDPAEIDAALDSLTADWTTAVPYERIAETANLSIPAEEIVLPTPDKANAVMIAGLNLELSDRDPDYPALVVANYVLGGGSLSSRLGDRVRQAEGLSYGVQSGLSAHPVDQRGRLSIFAITNPGNRERLIGVVREEVGRWQSTGVTPDELARAQQSLLQTRQLGRTDDRSLATLIGGLIFAGRDLQDVERLERQLAELTPQQVNETVKRRIDPNRILTIFAGDVEPK
ncbi:MAG TPA: pitrilysin family protein [Pirellulaceae bacterium]|nr:pitrilysin family protein [Pirellulaceae bacterium]